MASRRSISSNHRLPATSPQSARYGLVALLVITLITTVLVWLIPIEAFQQWAYNRAKPEPFARYEAIGAAEFLTWTARIGFPLLLYLTIFVFRRIASSSMFVVNLIRGCKELTGQANFAGNQKTFGNRWRTIGCRVILLAWLLLFVGHAVYGFGQRAYDWPYFHFNSGQVVLPNISDSNRAVIRYLLSVTPPGSRILVASDQKLFFLSYYLRPRTLFHKMHPESEHVIPLADQKRKLNAYRLNELTAEDLRQIPHDYTLEYFEHPDLVNRGEVLDDRNWVTFYRTQQRDPSLVPSFLVRLRKVGDSQP